MLQRYVSCAMVYLPGSWTVICFYVDIFVYTTIENIICVFFLKIKMCNKRTTRYNLMLVREKHRLDFTKYSLSHK